MAMRLSEREAQVLLTDISDKPSKGMLVATGLGGPGFSVWPLRDREKQDGYDAHTVYPPLPLLINFGFGVEKKAKDAAKKLRDRNGGEPIAGVGWSLGGNQLLRVAYEDPELIDIVFTLGSPCRFVGTKPDEVTVVSFVGSNGRWWDGVVPAVLASSPDHDETIKVKPNHFLLPKSRKVRETIKQRLGLPSSQEQRAPLDLVQI